MATSIDMAGRPKILNSQARLAVTRGLERYLADNPGLSGARLAKHLGVSRQAVSRYITGNATPSAEVLAKLVEIPGISLPFAGRNLNSQDFPQARPRIVPKQLDLLAEQPFQLRSPNEELDARFKKTAAGFLEIRMKIRVR